METRRLMARFGPWVLALLIACVVYVLRDVLTPFLLAALVAYILDPLVTHMEKRGLSRGAAVGLLVVLILVVMAILLPILAHWIAVEASQFIKAVPDYIAKVSEQISAEEGSRIPEWVRTWALETAANWQETLPALGETLGDRWDKGLTVAKRRGCDEMIKYSTRNA